LAPFLVSRLRATRVVAAGLGRRFKPGSRKVQRASLVSRISLALNPGYLLRKK